MARGETTLSDLLDVLQEHTLALKAHTAALDRAAGGGEKARPPEKEPEKEPERTERRGRGSRSEKADDKKTDAKAEGEYRDQIRKFLNAVDELFDKKEDQDAEYDKRIAAVFDPIFEKAKVDEPKDIPAEYLSDLAKAMEDYTSDFEKRSKKSEEPSSRRRRA
jgi:uncharacterized FlaG/YvyC family protein